MKRIEMVASDWHLDKKVPIGLLVGLIVQTIVMVSVGTSLFERMDSRITALEKSDSVQDSHENRVTVLEQKFEFIRSDLTEIKNLLRRTVPADQ